MGQLLGYSTVCAHFSYTKNCIHWTFTQLRSGHESNDKTKHIKVCNYIISLILDIILGICVVNFVASHITSEEFNSGFEWTSEYFVQWLTSLLKWLAGSPAGFKLNDTFNGIQCKFYQFHTAVWSVFISYLSPTLPVIYILFKFIGLLGITFQAAILSDLLFICTFHIYCIYAYAARLYCIQLSGLMALFRLFVGKKWNPLRQKIDSCNYTPQQLCIGTFGFTFLLFLLPTTLLYYIVFMSTRLMIVILGAALTRIRVYLHAMPVFSTMLWLLRSPKVCSQMSIVIEEPCHQTVLKIVPRLAPASFNQTIARFIPDCCQLTPFVEPHLYSNLIAKIVYGYPLYPKLQ